MRVIRGLTKVLGPLLPLLLAGAVCMTGTVSYGLETSYVLKASDAYGSSSFASVGNWVTNGTSNAATTAPGAGGAYNTGVYTLRTPTSGATNVFLGDSLTLSSGAAAGSGSLMLKGPDGAMVVISSLVLSGGILGQGVNSGSGGIEWVSGAINVVSNSTVSGLGTTARYIGIASTISGSALLSNDCNVVYTGNNAGFVGRMMAGAGGSIQISDVSNLGGAPTNYQADQLILNNGTLVANNSLYLNNSNSGITLASGGGGFANASGTSLVVSNTISGSGALSFSGAGDLVLAGTNTYTGATVVNGGRLWFAGPKSGAGNISVMDGATLAVSCTNATLMPTTLKVGTNAGATLEFYGVWSTTTAPLIAGTLTSTGAVGVVVRAGSLVVGQSYPLLSWTSGSAPVVALASISGASGRLVTSGNTVSLYVTPPATVPVASAKFEAESGTLGTNFAVSNTSSPAYITITNDGAGYNPGSSARVATYAVVFPVAGAYQLYARVRVNSGGASDDSLFYGNGFGTKSPTNDSDWIFVNGLYNVGFTASNSVVTGAGTAGQSVWKWINLSQFASGPEFVVPAGSLVQTFQIGARENGLDMDAFAFGLNGMTFTPLNLDAGVDGTPPVAGVTTVSPGDLRQRIDGFGGGVVFLTPSTLDPVTDANMDTLYGTNGHQLGLSLLRVRIDPTTNWSAALSDGKKAVARGARVFATPWTPPATMKDNTNLISGSLLASNCASYAAYLNNFAGYMKTNGAPLAAVSVQNEPDFNPSYEGCLWTSNQFLAFFRTNASAITNAPVMMPESYHFDNTLSDATLNDAVAVTNVGVVGGHLYGGTVYDYTNAHAHGKPTWMTEYLINDQTMSSAVDTARQIHDCLTTGNMSAYVWWKTLGDTNGLVNASGVAQKRGYVMAQFSRFVRPGDCRVSSTNSDGLGISAYRNTNSGSLVIVAVNDTCFPLTPTIRFTNASVVASVTPWLTSADYSLEAQPGVAVTNGAFACVLPAQSVVTFVGQMNTAPQFLATATQSVNPGVTMALTNTVVDAEAGRQTYAFSLLVGPTNAALTVLGATNVSVSWRPAIGQAGTSNWISLKVADNGSPSLSATNGFAVLVNPLGSLPAIRSVSSAGAGSLRLQVAGPSGPDYTVWTTTNFQSWEAVLTTNSPAMPWGVTLSNLNDAARFYRIQIGP
jgi:glucuronoarabinoxylan endo-1,4-beta-xylanase